jgi:WS/DGAT/MGAT family acyltransferase
MDPIDAAWLHMDGPANPAVITGILLTRRPLDFGKVRKLYRERLLGFERFRQRVVERGLPLAQPVWEDAEDFDLDRHLHHVALPAPGDAAALRRHVEDLASAPLDRSLPLWHVQVIDGVEGGSALVMRCHHCIADGTAMMTVVSRLFDREARPRASAAAPARRPRRVPAPSWLASAFETVQRAGRAVVEASTHPGRVIEQAALAVDGAATLLKELLEPADPPSPFKGEFATPQRVAWSQPVAIADVKAIGQRHGAKVNDVLVAAMTGALRAYLRRRGVDVAHTRLHASVPVDLRRPEQMGELGNRFGLVILELPIASARRAQRLALTKARMDALKRSTEPVAMRVLLDLFGRGPKLLEDIAVDVFGSRASLVMTNVAGPRETLYLAGVPIDRMMFWVPHPGRQLGVGISIMSYRGWATLSVIADARLVPDPDWITTQFQREFDAMLRLERSAAVKPPSATKRVSRQVRSARRGSASPHRACPGGRSRPRGCRRRSAGASR